MTAKKQAQFVQYGFPKLTIFLSIIVVLCGAAFYIQPIGSTAVPFVVSLILTLVMLIFFKMCITVNAKGVSWQFNFKFLKKSIDRKDIVKTEIITCPWYWGVGIRLTPHGVMYNVSGSKAIKICKADGTSVLIGTDQPVKLKQSIEQIILEKRVTTSAGRSGKAQLC